MVLSLRPFRRILPILRKPPIRPNHRQWSSPRLFTQHPQLLLLPRPSLRPRLPFLHPSTAGRRLDSMSRIQFQYQVSRLLNTQRRIFLKDLFRQVVRFTALMVTSLVLFRVLTWGVQLDLLHRLYLPPEEWTVFSQIMYCLAQEAEKPIGSTGIINWADAGQRYLTLILRLEDDSVDGQEIRPILQEEGDIYIEGVGKSGLDISMKPEPWRRGYYETLMSMARVAENAEGWVLDESRKMAFPGVHVIGPSNPHHRPLPPGSHPPPREEDCVPLFETPQKFYMKILTTNGFTSGQRLNAAVAYADWLDYKGLSSTAGDMYKWALDIATKNVPVGDNNVVDVKTGVINSSADYMTSNLLLATTSLAYHYARNNNLSAALPIYLSVLRVRRQLPEAPVAESIEIAPDRWTWDFLSSYVKSILASPPNPPCPPTGDEPAVLTPRALCEEAAIMSHIGEILFASSVPSLSSKKSSDTAGAAQASMVATADQSKTQESGLSWTREAVDLAEATISSLDINDEDARKTCVECLAMGVENWSTMVETILKQERLAKSSIKPKSTGYLFWGGDKVADQEARWEQESKIAEERLRKIRSMILIEEERKREMDISAQVLSLIQSWSRL